MCKKEPGLHWLTVALAAASMGLCASALASDATPPIRAAAGDPQAADFLIVDNFESYTDEEGSRLYEFWWEPITSSASAIYGEVLPPAVATCERRIVRSGRQSLALDYDNTCRPYCTRFERTWDSAVDWTASGLDTLVLYVRGQTTNDPDPLYVTVQDSAGKALTAVFFDPNAIAFDQWFRWEVRLDKYTLAGVNPRAIKRLSINVGDRTCSKRGGTGRIYVDDIMVVRASTFAWLEPVTYVHPEDGDVNVPPSLVLQWWPGGAAFHDVYFGEDANTVRDASPFTEGIYRGRQAQNDRWFDPGPLDWNKTYFWRIDEVNDANPTSPVKSEVWRFTTTDFLVVDDFESYTDRQGEWIDETWIDGHGAGLEKPGNGTGAIVWYTSPGYARELIVHTGEQAMPFNYDNSRPPYYSETYRAWATPQDWAARGEADLGLWVYGWPLAFEEKQNDRIVLNGDGVWDDKTEGFVYVRKRLTGDGSIVARVESIEDTDGWARAGIMIRETTTIWSPSGPRLVSLGITPTHGVTFAYSSKAGRVRQESNVADVQTPRWLRLTRAGRTFTAQHSDDNLTWQGICDANDRPITFEIHTSETVEIGLFVASNKSGMPTRAEFSAVTIAGDVSDSWEAVGINAKAGRNAPAPLYVALEDAAGILATVVHPDPAAVNIAGWTQWRIPLSEFAAAGVDVRMVARMYLGVGDRDNPQPGDTGRIYIDDIHVLKP